MPTLVIKHPDGQKQESILEGELTIGRSDGNNVVLSEGGVSRKHARFFETEENCSVEDVGSANGTWVDGERIVEAVALTAKSVVVIGDYEIRLKPRKVAKPTPKSSAPPVALAKRSAPLKPTRPLLRGLSVPIEGKSFVIEGTMTIGRVAGLDIRIEDDSVSRQHAEVMISGTKVLLKDLGSANGTTINGSPIASRMTLSDGDIIQFGIVELMFENAAAVAVPKVVPRERVRAVRRADVNRADWKEVLRRLVDSKKKRLVLAGALLGVLLLALMFKLATRSSVSAASNTDPSVATQGVQLDALLAACRSFADPEQDAPDWQRAREACEKVLELEPIDREANALVKKIGVFEKCEATLKAATEHISVNQLEAALDSFGQIGKDCGPYLLRARSKAQETLNDVKKRSAADCKLYLSNAKWELAYKRCELYARLACQMMEPKDLYPPPTMRLKLEGSLRPKNEWRPSDPTYLAFLKVRERVKPGEPMWSCPEFLAFRPPPPPPDAGKLAKDEIMARYPDREMAQAVVLYFEGRFADAPVPLKKIGENMSKAELHEAAKQLLNDVSNAINLYDNGMGEISNDRLERAESTLLRALALDEKLVLGERGTTLKPEEKSRELDRRVSFLRKNIVESMGSRSLQKGRALADRNDFRGACKIWKLGGKFSDTNIDLLKALTNACTARAKAAFANAESCEQLKAVLDFAVDGDTFKEKVVEVLAQKGCP